MGSLAQCPTELIQRNLQGFTYVLIDPVEVQEHIEISTDIGMVHFLPIDPCKPENKGATLNAEIPSPA